MYPSTHPLRPFTYTGLPSRVLFGFGTLAELANEVGALNCSHAVLVCTPRQLSQVQRVADGLGGLCVGVIGEATMHTPIEISERALDTFAKHRGDCVVALGGGSAIGLSKAIALRTHVPQIVVPTTYAGSEATPVLGETQNGIKTTRRNAAVLPQVILYDVELTLQLPRAISAASGLNAIAHAVEALYAQDANPLTSSLACEAIKSLVGALPTIVQDPGNREARARALYGAWLCGVCLATVGMSLHHKLCHTLGGAFNLPHAQTHAVLLAHAVAYNARHAPAAIHQLQQVLGVTDVAGGLQDLTHRLGLPRSLADLGLPRSALERIADLTVANPYWSPRAIERGPILALLEDAYVGRAPTPTTQSSESMSAHG